jgi:hypothetical protein
VRRPATLWLLGAGILPFILVTACDHAPSPAEIADRGWRAHELVIAAGEHSPTCAAAGFAMQQSFAANRQAFVDAIALDHDRERLAEARPYLEQRADRYADLDTRMAALSARCGDDPLVARVFRSMENPDALVVPPGTP